MFGLVIKMSLENTFQKIFLGLLPLFSLAILIHFVIFIISWFVRGCNDEKYQGITGIIRYYFFTWNWVFINIKELIEYKESEKESNTD